VLSPCTVCSAQHEQFHSLDHDHAARHRQQDWLGQQVVVVIAQQPNYVIVTGPLPRIS